MAGFGLFLFFMLFPVRRFVWMIPAVYWINIAMLIMVKFVGISRLGAQRWIEIPFINFTIQPSEIMKPSLILMLAYLIKSSPPTSERGYGMKEFLKLGFYIILPFTLIYIEPDLGTALILLVLGFGVLFIVGVDYKIWIGIAVALSIAIPAIYPHINDYQKRRVKDFLSKKPSYQVRQSIIAIGSGGLYGKERGEATQTHMKFLPIATSDFIFAFFVERFGFVGGVVLIAIYALLILHFLMMILYLKGDYFSQVISASLALLFFLYASVNIAMTLGYAPVVGLPLPLFSYGGSSFITFMILLGIYENLVTFRFKKFSSVLSP
jgi:rod shape determining protein RodA